MTRASSALGPVSNNDPNVKDFDGDELAFFGGAGGLTDRY